MAENKGEGSRGGHIIGHTKTGNPIYDSQEKATSISSSAPIPQQNRIAKSPKAAAIKSLARAGSITAGMAHALGSRHFQWGLNVIKNAGGGTGKAAQHAAMGRSFPLVMGGLAGGLISNVVGGYAAQSESKDRGDSELQQGWENLKEQVFEGTLTGVASYGTYQGYGALKKVGPQVRQNVEAAAKVTRYAGLKATRFGLSSTRGIRNSIKFAKAKPFITESFTAASRLLPHLK